MLFSCLFLLFVFVCVAPWTKALLTIRNHLTKAIKAYYDYKKTTIETISSHDISNRPEGEIIPIIPDVAIQVHHTFAICLLGINVSLF